MQSCVHFFFFFCPTDRPTITRGRTMGNATFYGDGLIVKGGFRGGGVGTRKRRPLLFSLKFCVIFIEFSVYIAGKCSGHSFLNFLDPPQLMNPIKCAGKSTTPLNSLASCVARLREKLNKFSSGVGNWWRPPLPFCLITAPALLPRVPFQSGRQANPLPHPLRPLVKLKFILRSIK